MPRLAWCSLSLLAVAVAFASPKRAVAQSTPSGVVLSVPPSDASLAPFAAAVERVERGRLDSLGVVHVSSAPALSLADLQLAVGCLGEGDDCLRAVAGQLTVDVLVYATVDRAGDTRIVTIHYYDARGHDPARQAQREGAEAECVEQIEPMLRELLGLPPVATVEPHVDDRVHHDEAPAGRPHDATMLVLSLTSFGVAVVATVVGAIFGALELGSAQAWSTALPMGVGTSVTPTGIDAAFASLDRANEQATIANVMFVVAGVAAAAGVTFLVLDLTAGPSHADRQTSLALVPAGSGLALRGGW